MIRINLLAPERTSQEGKAAAARRGAGRAPERPADRALRRRRRPAVRGRWWFQSGKLRQLDQHIAPTSKRQGELQAIQKQVDEFQKKKATLENKVSRHRAPAAGAEEPGAHAGRDLQGPARLRLADDHGREPGQREVHRARATASPPWPTSSRPPAQRLVPVGRARLRQEAQNLVHLRPDRPRSRIRGRRPKEAAAPPQRRPPPGRRPSRRARR